VGVFPDVVARECDRALLARAQANAPEVHRRLELLLELARAVPRALPGRLVEVAESAARLLENPKGVYLAYYPVAPGTVVRGKALSVRLAGCAFIFTDFRLVALIIFYPPSRLTSDPELRYVLAHELAHAAGYEDEEDANLLADTLTSLFPRTFTNPARCAQEYASKGEPVADWPDFNDWVRRHLREFHDSLFRCCEELKPVEG
jgi:hypothetical protein